MNMNDFGIVDHEYFGCIIEKKRGQREEKGTGYFDFKAIKVTALYI